MTTIKHVRRPGGPEGNGQPPAAQRIPKQITYHEDCLTDDYFWLREKSNPDVAAYLEAENAYADAVMADTAEPPAGRLYKEI